MGMGRRLGILVAVATVLRLAWAVVMPAGHDEAYHALFPLHPDWSYFDHPPMLAVVTAVGMILGGGASEAPLWMLRAGFIALFAGSTILLARLTAREFGPRAGVLAAVALNLSAYHTVAAGAFLLPDGPLLFFWLLAVDRLIVAMERPDRVGGWLAVGLAWGGALLSKYHAVLLPSGFVLYLLWTPGAWRLLKRRGPWLALAVGGLCFTPVLYWNAARGWNSFAFQGGRAVGWTFRPDSLLGFIGGPAAYLTPWIWAFLLVAAWRAIRRVRAHVPATEPGESTLDADRFFLALAAPAILGFGVISCVRPILPHWPLIGFVMLMPLLGRDWAEAFADRPKRLARRVAVLSSVVVILAAVYAAHGRWGILQGRDGRLLGVLPLKHDPTLESYGWDQLAEAIVSRGVAPSPETFLFTSTWFGSGQLAFGLRGKEPVPSPVLCYRMGGAHSFADWSRPEDWIGWDGILVVPRSNSPEPQKFDRWFRRIEALEPVAIRRGGEVVRMMKLYRCVGQSRPFPFASEKGVAVAASRRDEEADRAR